MDSCLRPHLVRHDALADETCHAYRVRLLTLLNVAATKPSPSESTLGHCSRAHDRDWLAIAKQAARAKRPRNHSPPSLRHSSADAGSPDCPMDRSGPRDPSNRPPDDGLKEAQPDGSVSKVDPRTEEKEENGLGADSPQTDAYSHHFGAETQVLDPKLIALAQSEMGWRLDSNRKAVHHRLISFLPAGLESPFSSGPRQGHLVVPPAIGKSFKSLSGSQRRFLETMETYRDVWHTDLVYDHQRNEPRVAASFWAMHHILKTRKHVLKNNAYLAQLEASKAVSKTQNPDHVPAADDTPRPPAPSLPDREIRDQGFTRPKVLLLVPLRATGLEWVNTLVSTLALNGKVNVKGLDRFRKEFSLPPGTVDRLEGEDAELKYTLEHRIVFRGNIDDDFKLGLKFTRHNELKLYSQFYQADLILASPVALRKLIEKEGDSDFLSSIEMAIVDQMDVMLMQNWDHVEFVFDHLNQTPQKPRDTDFSRVKPWYLDGHSRYLRQTILFSSTISPEQNSLFRRCLKNLSGKSICFHGTLASRPEGLLEKLRSGIKQTWLRLPLTSIEKEPEVRLQYFKENVFDPLFRPSALVRAGMGGIMIFVSSYFEFLSLEDFFKSQRDDIGEEEVRYAAISEYSSHSEVQAARSAFYNRHVSYLIITERFHFYHRYRIRGAKMMVFYSLPVHAEYYLEFVNDYPFDKQPSGNSSHGVQGRSNEVDEVAAMVLYSEMDRFKVEKIVGLADCKQLISGSVTRAVYQ